MMRAACSELYPKMSVSTMAVRCRGGGRSQHATDVLPEVHVIERVAAAGHGTTFLAAIACTPCMHPDAVQRDAEQVCDRILDRVEPVPPLPELQERVLHEFLRVGRAARDEVQRSVQAIVHVEEELFEARWTRGHLAVPVQLDDVVLGLHATMDARRIPIV